MDPASGALAVVLVETRNPLNIGAVARAMSNFGASDLRLVNPYEASFREAVSAVNAGHVLRGAAMHREVASAVADCHLVVASTGVAHRKPAQPLFSLEQAGLRIRGAMAAGRRVGLLFGSEKHGLSNEHMACCHWLLRIPTRPEHESMNLGQAVAVCLYELCRDPVPPPVEEEPAADAKALDRLAGLYVEALSLAGYLDFGSQPSALLQMQRLVRRLNLSCDDASIWTGIVRQLLWKLKSGSSGVP